MCSLLASPTLAAEDEQLAMTDMGLRVTSSPEAHLNDGDTWIVTARNNYSLSEAEITNFLPSRMTKDLRQYVRLSKVIFTDSSHETCKLYFDITSDPTDIIQFVIKETPQNFQIEILPLESKNGQISMTDIGLKVTSPPESHLENGDVWVITAKNNYSLSEAEITNFLPSRISEDLKTYISLFRVDFTYDPDKTCKLYFNVISESINTVRFTIKEYPKNFPIEILPYERDNYISTTNFLDNTRTNGRKEITYYNGLGYPSQKIEVGTSNKNKSIFHLYSYDKLLRNDAKSYLPYAHGANTEFYDLNYAKNIETFYSHNYDEYTHYFSEKIYEDSPLGRVREMYGPGSDWRSQKVNTKFSYLSNIAGNDTLNCLRFEMTDKNNQSIDLKVAGNYISSELYVTRTENEDHQITLEFKNKFDQVVLSRQIEHNKNNKTNYDTYYLYDEFDNLKAVLPPMTVAQLIANNSYSSQTSAPLAQYAYLYKYDMRSRCIATKLPGCDWEYKVYDLADHLIFSQTGEQRKRGEWQFLLPDAMGRECITGICKNTIDPFNNPILNTCIKCERTNNINSYLGYSITGISLNSATILTAKYYDNYLFKVYDDTPIFNSNLKYEAVSGFGEKYETSSQGLQTGSVTARLDKNGSAIGYDYNVVYYDYNGRAIQIGSTNHLGGYEKTYTAYNFTGQPVHIKHIHSKSYSELIEENKHAYDCAGRLSESVQIIDGKDSTRLTYLYDDLGNVKSLTRTDGTSTLTTANTYNIRNWLTSIKSPLFSQTLHYTDGLGTPQYGGNISSMTWETGKESITRNYLYSYDKLSRLTNAIYSEGSSANQNINHFNEQVTGYDKEGNITGLKRYGQTGQNSYGLIDNLSLTYIGNQLKKVTDNATSSAYANSFEFKDGVNLDTEYSYDGDGNLTKDLNKNISNIQYNFLNLPRCTKFEDGSEISYLYSADGTKLQTTHIISGNTTTTDYCGNVIYENGKPDKLLTEQGYFSLTDKKFHYYLQDHQGNNRVVVNPNGTVEEVNHYYPFGGIFANSSSTQPYKYNGKELDTKKGVNLYDYGARQYDAALGKWHTTDPMAEKYYEMSPYNYCGNDPINLIDPNGNYFTRYQDQYGNLLRSTNDGNNDKVTVPNERLNEFREHLLYTSDYLLNSKGWNEYWTDEFKGTEAFQATPEQQAVLDMQHSDWARKNGIEYWKNPSLWNWMKYVTSEVLSQYTDPQLLVGGATIGLKGSPSFIKGLDNPFRGKSFRQIDKMFKTKRFTIRGIDPLNGKGSYINPATGTRYYLDKGGIYKKGFENPHVDVWYNNHPSYEKAKFFIDGSPKMYTPLK